MNRIMSTVIILLLSLSIYSCKEFEVKKDYGYEDDKCNFISRLPNAVLRCYSSNGEMIHEQWIVRYDGALCTTDGREIRIHNMQCIEESR